MKVINLKTCEAQFAKILIYGASGSGKTTAIKTLPVESTIIICTEHQTKTRLAGTGYTLYEMESWVDISETIYNMLLKDDESENPKYKTVVIDSLSFADELGQRQILGAKSSAKNGEKKDTFSMETMTIDGYKKLKGMWTDVLYKFTGLNKHIIAIARESGEKDDMLGVINYIPDITGKIAQNLGAFFTEVFRIEANTNANGKFENRLVCKKLNNNIAKGPEQLSLYETGENKTIDLTLIIKKIFNKNGGKK